MLTLVPVLLLAAFQSSDAHSPVSLFNGKDLVGWRGRPHLDPAEEADWSTKERQRKQADWDANMRTHWRVENGEIVNDGKGVFLTTSKDYGDFDLRLEYKTVALADSGIYLRACPQVQIWDWTEKGGKWGLGAKSGSGGLWNNQSHSNLPLKRMDRPFGHWNALRIQMVGARVSVFLNGLLVVDHVSMENYWDRGRPVPVRGPIQLQTHGGEIRWRNLSLREIEAGEANQILAASGSEEFLSVFNGVDFQGWSGATKGWEVREAAMRCKPGSGGTVFTNVQYENFAARFQFRLPPGGNNGLAIRYPGFGDTAYLGMCELQVLDNTAEKYNSLKPWQYHGSAYGMVPAHRGFLRPTGFWNHQDVTVDGSKITVELNGFLILDCDLAEIQDPPSGKEHPGRTRTSGHFGFAGHGDPVEFRNIQIQER